METKLKEKKLQSSAALTFRMLGFLKPVRHLAAIAALIIFFRVGFEVLSVYLISPAITSVVEGLSSQENQGFWLWFWGPAPSADELRGVLLWMILSQMALAVLTYLGSVWETKLSMRAVFHIRGTVYDCLQKIPLSFYNRVTSGQLINRAINDLQAVRNFVNLSLLCTLDIALSLAMYLGLLFIQNPLLILAALLPLPLWCLLIFRFNLSAQTISLAQRKASDRMMTAVTENISGAHVVRAFGTSAQEIDRFERANNRLLKWQLKGAGLNSFLTPSLKFVGSTAHIILFLCAAHLIQRSSLKIGDLMLLGAAMAAILSKLQQVNSIIDAYQKAIVSSRRLFEIIDSPSVEAKNCDCIRKPGDIHFSDVTFSYDANPVLHNLSFTIPEGKVTALVGPTGSGKSTLAGLIARFYEPDSGSIFIEQTNLDDLDLKSLRYRVGFVFQETFLFSGTIRENILYGRSDVSEDMMRTAARTAHAEEFILSLAHGYDTVLGEKGVALSGGQRQRLALARALIYDPPILILDEATSALDPTTKQIINDRLDLVFKGRTVLIIANHLNNLESIDQVLILDKGRIVESGSPQELKVNNGAFNRLVDESAISLQLSGFAS